jgi:hypothetical protein
MKPADSRSRSVAGRSRSRGERPHRAGSAGPIREDTVKKLVRNAGWKYGTGDRIAIVIAAIRAGEIAL